MDYAVAGQPLGEKKKTGTGDFIEPGRIIGSFGLSVGMSAADFGCGSGYFTMLMAEKVGESGRVYALDVQRSALEGLESKARHRGVSNIEMIHANLEVLGASGLADGSQDFVLIANALFQSSKKEQVLKEAHRVLKPGGSLAVIDWKKGGGGFGPPDSIRMDIDAVKNLFLGEKFQYDSDIEAGDFHFGLKFKKI